MNAGAAQENGLKTLLDKRCIMVAGKGGVGRSTVSAALAMAGERHGKRVLLTEVAEEGDDYSPLAKYFRRSRLPSTPEEVWPGIRGVALLPRTGQEMFLRSVLSGPISRAALSSETIRRLLNAGPSFREMGVFFQLLSYLRAKREDGSPEYEIVIIDMPATGHTLSLTGLPELLLKLISRGPIAEHLRDGMAFLNDPARAAAWIVTLPETLPVTECLELLDGLTRTKVPVGGIILNKVPTDTFSVGERDALRPVVEKHRVYGGEGFHKADVSRRAAGRLRSATQARLLALPLVELPEYDLIAFLARALEDGGILEAFLDGRSRPERATS